MCGLLLFSIASIYFFIQHVCVTYLQSVTYCGKGGGGHRNVLAQPSSKHLDGSLSGKAHAVLELNRGLGISISVSLDPGFGVRK